MYPITSDSKKSIIDFYCSILNRCHWRMADIVIKEMKKELDIIRENELKIECEAKNKPECLQQRTTVNVRFRWLKAIFTQISKLASYIRKRCVQFGVKGKE